MSSERPIQDENSKFPRRRFIRDVATAATVTCLSPTMLAACRSSAGGGQLSATRNVDAMDQALEMMAKLAPLTNHGPMAAEALVVLGRADEVPAFVNRYMKRFTDAYPPPLQTVTRANWREALGEGRRVADWSKFFRGELNERPWRQVLEQWSAALAPGLSAAAAHGLIRTGHAVRSLANKETNLRLVELSEGLGYWAAYYQLLPAASNLRAQNLKPSQAISRIPLLPAEKLPRNGSLMIGLQRLNDFPPFAGAANLVESTGNAGEFFSEVTEAFADAFVKNVNQRNVITLIHSITGITALRSMVLHLSPPTTHSLMRYGWQLAAALYSLSGIGSFNQLPEAKEIKSDNLIDRAVASREEHAIKFTEACLREHALNPKPVYLQAAHDALERIRPV